MTDAAVKTSALEAGIKSLTSVGDRLVRLAAAADGQLDDDREVIGDIATAMTNVRTEVAAVSRKLDVVQRASQQREYERDVALHQAREAEARQTQAAADGRTTMQLMAAGCVLVCLATGFAARWWYGPASVVAVVEQRAPVSTPPVPPVPVAPVVGAGVTTSTSGVMPAGATAPPQTGGDYACAFEYGRPPGQRCR